MLDCLRYKENVSFILKMDKLQDYQSKEKRSM